MVSIVKDFVSMLCDPLGWNEVSAELEKKGLF